jgi:hypothetical protein
MKEQNGSKRKGFLVSISGVLEKILSTISASMSDLAGLITCLTLPLLLVVLILRKILGDKK